MGIVTRMAEPHRPSMLEAARAGNELAFRWIIGRYHEDMRRVCLAICRDPAMAEEATQTAWFIAWNKLGKVRGENELRPWLVSVAVNETKKLMHKRRRRSEVEVAVDLSTAPGGVDPAAGVAGIDLRAALARLDPDDAALLAMRYIAGFDSNELALATGISPSGTRSRIERLLRRLRKDLIDG